MDNPLGYPQTPQPLESINLVAMYLCLLCGEEAGETRYEVESPPSRAASTDSPQGE
jgi:hypothetical protein